jgi:hypothetical protein
VWIRFPGLNILYYDESVLLGLASIVGTPMKVNMNTLNVERDRFARICVEIDLTLPVFGKINVNDHWYNVQYEGLHIICGRCGCYDHYIQDCKETPTICNPTVVPKVAETMGLTNTRVTNDETTGEQSRESDVVPAITSEESNNVHGDWLVV